MSTLYPHHLFVCCFHSVLKIHWVYLGLFSSVLHSDALHILVSFISVLRHIVYIFSFLPEDRHIHIVYIFSFLPVDKVRCITPFFSLSFLYFELDAKFTIFSFIPALRCIHIYLVLFPSCTKIYSLSLKK